MQTSVDFATVAPTKFESPQSKIFRASLELQRHCLLRVMLFNHDIGKRMQLH